MGKVRVRCEVEKAETEFPLNRYGHKTYKRNTCRECYNTLRKNHEDDDKPDGLICKMCGEYKSITWFPRNRQCLYGVEPVCKACKRQRRREYIRLYPERARNADLKYQYGITITDYEVMYARQGGRCAICGTSEAKLVVDHNHKTNQVRELLCHLCNAMIGCAREDIAILMSAAAYLHREQHPEQESNQTVCMSSCNASVHGRSVGQSGGHLGHVAIGKSRYLRATNPLFKRSCASPNV